MNDPYTEDHNSQPENEQHPPLTMGFGFLPRLMQPGWSELAFLFLKRCPKYFFKPAMLLAFASISPPLELFLLNTFMKSVSNHGPFTNVFDIALTFIPALIGLLILAVGALVAMVWGLGTLLVALTATCRTFLIIDSQHFGQETPALERGIATAQEEGINLFRHKKAYLTKVWLMYSLFMLLPTIVMFASWSVVLLGMPPIGGVPMPIRMDVPSEMMVGSAIALGVSITVLTNYALILLPFSSLTQRKATGAAIGGLLVTVKTLPAISIYSVIFFVLSTIFTSPVDLLLIFNQQLITGPLATIFFLLLKVLLHVLVFVYLVPISMLIPCEMIRGNIE